MNAVGHLVCINIYICDHVDHRGCDSLCEFSYILVMCHVICFRTSFGSPKLDGFFCSGIGNWILWTVKKVSVFEVFWLLNRKISPESVFRFKTLGTGSYYIPGGFAKTISAICHTVTFWFSLTTPNRSHLLLIVATQNQRARVKNHQHKIINQV